LRTHLLSLPSVSLHLHDDKILPHLLILSTSIHFKKEHSNKNCACAKPLKNPATTKALLNRSLTSCKMTTSSNPNFPYTWMQGLKNPEVNRGFHNRVKNISIGAQYVILHTTIGWKQSQHMPVWLSENRFGSV
jgi:hypothetical protein